MNFKIQVRDERDREPWWEEFNYHQVVDQATAEGAAADMIAKYNNTMCPGDSPRTLLSVVFAETGTAHQHHDWRKQNLMTIASTKRVAAHDAMKCRNCGITGKRFGLTGTTRDAEFKAKAFEYCDTAKDLLAKRRERQSSIGRE